MHKNPFIFLLFDTLFPKTKIIFSFDKVKAHFIYKKNLYI